MRLPDVEGVQIKGPVEDRAKETLTGEALGFLVALHREFNDRRQELLARRSERQLALDEGEQPSFHAATRGIREDASWRVARVSDDLVDRRVEITGPTDRKMVINALNSGASVFMADFEDANAPTWDNMVTGQANLIDAVEGSISLETPGKTYRLGGQPATLMVRPRGWHLEERHVLVDGGDMSASLFDFGLCMYHCARRLVDRGSGPYFYLPKLESHTEARLWNDVFNFAQDALGIPRGTIRATVLVETILAAFEMEEILYELREHSAGLNAGRWDYLFSIIKKFRRREGFLLPDRNSITMTAPFMRAYTELLVRTSHRRGAHAIGGMAAFIPSRKDPEINDRALAKVREDKVRESGDGFDGTWVAHPDLVSTAREPFDHALGDKPDQRDRLREEVTVTADDLLRFEVPGGEITEEGLRGDVSVGVQYIASWLRGVGAAAISNLMEDAATSEIARSQVWQWVHHGATLKEGAGVTPELVRKVEDEEVDRIRQEIDHDAYESGRFEDARAIFEDVALGDDFVEFLTIPAYRFLD
jgi:malate synthase